MKRLLFLCSFLAVTAGTQVLSAQPSNPLSTQSGAFGTRSFGGGVSGSSDRNQALSQTGQVSAEGAIQRQEGGFVGASSSNMANIRSAQASGLGTTGGFGTTSGLGTGLSTFGVGGLGSTGLGTFGTGYGSTFGRTGYGGAFGGQQNAQNLNNQTQTRGNLRIPLRLGFARPRSVATASAASLRLAERLKKIRQVEAVGEIAVSSVGRTVVLRGTVATEQARSLAERVALLEPGVSEVRNELEVAERLPPLPGN